MAGHSDLYRPGSRAALAFALGSWATFAMCFSGCQFDQRVPVQGQNHTYLGDLEDYEVVRARDFVEGRSCDTFVPFINLQDGEGTTQEAITRAHRAAREAHQRSVGLANMTVEVEQNVNLFGNVAFIKRCIVVTGQPLVRRGRRVGVPSTSRRARHRRGGRLMDRDPESDVGDEK